MRVRLRQVRAVRPGSAAAAAGVQRGWRLLWPSIPEVPPLRAAVEAVCGRPRSDRCAALAARERCIDRLIGAVRCGRQGAPTAGRVRGYAVSALPGRAGLCMRACVGGWLRAWVGSVSGERRGVVGPEQTAAQPQVYMQIYIHIPYMHAYMHVACIIHVCMHTCMHACMYACMPACLHACMPACQHACMYVCVYICVCTYLYICICASGCSTSGTLGRGRAGPDRTCRHGSAWAGELTSVPTGSGTRVREGEGSLCVVMPARKCRDVCLRGTALSYVVCCTSSSYVACCTDVSAPADVWFAGY